MSPLMQENLVRIELFGQPYTFKADTEVTQAQRVADMLAREVARLQAQQGGHTPQGGQLTLMILAALNIANENEKLKAEHEAALQRIFERSEKLLQRLQSTPLSEGPEGGEPLESTR